MNEPFIDKVRRLHEEIISEKTISDALLGLSLYAMQLEKNIIVTAPNGFRLKFMANSNMKVQCVEGVPYDLGNITNFKDQISFDPIELLGMQNQDEGEQKKHTLAAKEKMKRIVFAMLSQPECLFVTFGDN
ncbi:MAG: hypothetical protein V1928_03335 [Parcubacteria group bacterium]